MKFLFPILTIILLIVSCFLPWMTIESRGLTLTGVDTTGTTFGKPAYFHFLWAALYLIFLLLNKVWTRRVSIVFGAFNLAWAFRNFLLLPACQMGECPVKRIGLYLLLLSSIAVFIAGLLVPLKENEQTNKES